jgi:hypothetical protein
MPFHLPYTSITDHGQHTLSSIFSAISTLQAAVAVDCAGLENASPALLVSCFVSGSLHFLRQHRFRTATTGVRQRRSKFSATLCGNGRAV